MVSSPYSVAVVSSVELGRRGGARTQLVVVYPEMNQPQKAVNPMRLIADRRRSTSHSPQTPPLQKAPSGMLVSSCSTNSRSTPREIASR